jgi:DNA-binding NtrC family response regulator
MAFFSGSSPASSSVNEQRAAPARGRILVVDDEENMVRILVRILSDDGWLVEGHSDPRAAVESLRKNPPDLVLTDMRMPGMTGMEVLAEAKAADPATSVIVCTAYGTMEGAVDAMKAGACDYVSKPFRSDELLAALSNALVRTQLARENETLSEQVSRGSSRALSPDGISGNSPRIQAALAMADKAANSDVPVLILGESGTGKELFARRMHERGSSAKGRFVPINCASIPDGLMESELFGHEKGAFTGADRTKLGLMELASGGTLFLDEIGEMPLRLQGKLLRALQEQEIQRVGGLHTIPIRVRVVAATNRDLTAMAAAGEFRSDLLYRLDVLRMELPPLREREGDVLLLLNQFLTEMAARHGRSPLTIDETATQALEAWTWPGNARELRNLAERLNALVEGRPVLVSDLPVEVRIHAVKCGIISPDTETDFGSGMDQVSSGVLVDGIGESAGGDLDYRAAKEQFERQWLESLLKSAEGNMTTAAKMAGLSRRHLYEKLEKLGIRSSE